MFAGLGAGGAVCALAWATTKVLAVNRLSNYSGWMMPNLLGAPFLMGLTAAWVWRPLKLTIAQILLHSLSATLLAMLAAVIVLGERAVCLIIASPLVYGMTLAGAVCGWIWFRRDRDKLNLTILPLLALIVATEPQLHSAGQSVVTDEILIHAPPAQVWTHVLAFPEIPEPPRYWLFRLGLPFPTQTTNGGNFVGASRQCIFSSGVTLPERVVELVPKERLTFDITEQPADPEAYNHVTLHRGRFELRDNHDGTTTLVGSSWYSLQIRPRWYFGMWMDNATRAVHLRVMEHIRRLAEEGG
jgi:hypothetical protein